MTLPYVSKAEMVRFIDCNFNNLVREAWEEFTPYQVAVTVPAQPDTWGGDSADEYDRRFGYRE